MQHCYPDRQQVIRSVKALDNTKTIQKLQIICIHFKLKNIDCVTKFIPVHKVISIVQKLIIRF